nr:MAG TPA: hypothetical protein [Caudoviricetes sp.]
MRYRNNREVIITAIFKWIRRHRCSHHYCKHWSRDSVMYGGARNAIRSSGKHAEMRVIFMPCHKA